MFEARINRSDAINTRRSYRRTVMGFLDYLGIRRPDSSFRLLGATVVDVRAWREFRTWRGSHRYGSDSTHATDSEC